MNVTQTRSRTRVLTECAMMVAVSVVLMQIKLFSMPYGGSVTLCSMLPVILISYRNGTKWGLMTGLVLAVLQMITGWYAPPAGTFLAYFGMILLDYVLAFTMLGTASFWAKPFKNKYAGIAAGTAVVCVLRFCCSFLSGFLIWSSDAPIGESAVWYSLVYNGGYMLPEMVITVSAALLLYKFAPVLFGEAKAAKTAQADV